MGLSARYFLKSRGVRLGSWYTLVSAGRPIARRVTSTVTMRLGLFAGGQLGNGHEHLADAAFQVAIPHAVDGGRDLLVHDFHILFRPVGGNGQGPEHVHAGRAGGDHHADFPALRPFSTQHGAAGSAGVSPNCATACDAAQSNQHVTSATCRDLAIARLTKRHRGTTRQDGTSSRRWTSLAGRAKQG